MKKPGKSKTITAVLGCGPVTVAAGPSKKALRPARNVVDIGAYKAGKQRKPRCSGVKVTVTMSLAEWGGLLGKTGKGYHDAERVILDAIEKTLASGGAA